MYRRGADIRLSFVAASPESSCFPIIISSWYGKGAQSEDLGAKNQGIADPDKLLQMVDAERRLPLSQLIRLRVGDMTAKTQTYRMRGGNWDDLIIYRNLQLAPIKMK